MNRPVPTNAGTTPAPAPHLLSHQWSSDGERFIGAYAGDAPPGTRKADVCLTNPHIRADEGESNAPWPWDARKVEAEIVRRVDANTEQPIVIVDWEAVYESQWHRATITGWLSRGPDDPVAHLAALRLIELIDYIHSLLPTAQIAVYDLPNIMFGTVDWSGPTREVAQRCAFLSPVMYWHGEALARVQAKGIARAVSFGREIGLEVVPHIAIHEMVGPRWQRFGLTPDAEGVTDFDRRQILPATSVGVERFIMWGAEQKYWGTTRGDTYMLPYIERMVQRANQ